MTQAADGGPEPLLQVFQVRARTAEGRMAPYLARQLVAIAECGDRKAGLQRICIT